MTFKQQLDKVKKHVKPASRETYLRNIRRLRKATGQLPIPSTSKWLTEARLLKWYDSQPLNIRRHLSTAAKVAFLVYGKESEEWSERQSAAMKEFDDDRRKRQLTEKQKSAMPKEGFDALKHVVSSLRKELKHLLAAPKEWSLKDLLRVQELVIVSLYYDFPLRLDYADLKTDVDKGNYIRKRKKKPRGWLINLDDYKTSKSMGTQQFKPNRANQRLLNKFMPQVARLTEHNYLLTNAAGNKMTKQVLSKNLQTTFRKRVGKTFSVQLIRVLYAMKNRGVIESAKEVSRKLLHSTEQSLMYAKKA